MEGILTGSNVLVIFIVHGKKLGTKGSKTCSVWFWISFLDSAAVKSKPTAIQPAALFPVNHKPSHLFAFQAFISIMQT